MSGLRFTLDQFNTVMREQAKRKLDALRAVSSERTHVCQDDGVTMPAAMSGFGAKRTNRRQLIPKLSSAEERLAFHLKAEGLDGFVREHRFSKKRFWRFDFAFVSAKLAIEVDGGAGTGGRHTRKLGFERDCEKLNEAAILGWRVLRFTPSKVKEGVAVRTIRRALEDFRK